MSESVIRRWPRGLELAILAAALLGCMLPFANKAFHIDDTLFVWAGQQIQKQPLDFFGFDVNWYSTRESMAHVTQNPPGACYYLALAGSLFGWSEVSLHLAMLLPAWGLVWGTYRLAERFDVRPLPAALLTLFTPVTLVCASSVMCDVTMVCLWVWTVIAWDRGLRENRSDLLFIAGGLVALTTVTKYFGVCLIPLLGVYAYAVDRIHWRRWASALGIAVLLLAIYQAIFLWMYGRGGLVGAMGYAASSGSGSFGAATFRFFEGLGFIGGCVGVAAVATVLVLPARSRLAVLFAILVAAALSVWLKTKTEMMTDYELNDSPFAEGAALFGRIELLGQFLVWVGAGMAVLLLAANDLHERRDPIALLLFLWVFGTAVFAMYVNWALNGRSVLPLVPAVAMLIVRRFDRVRVSAWLMPAILALAVAFGLAVTVADAGMANVNRDAARELSAAYAPASGQTLWFRGHWGFQYYMEQHGGRIWDDEHPAGRRGELIVIPYNNNNHTQPEGITEEFASRDLEGCSWATTMSPFDGAGFYACSYDWRPLPFAFTNVRPEHFFVFRLTADAVPPKKK